MWRMRWKSLREDKEEKTQGAEGDGRVKDKEPAAI